MNSYLSVTGHEVTLGELNEALAQNCLALEGLKLLIGGTLKSKDLGEKECGCLTLAGFALEVIARQAESLLPDWNEVAE